jgi:hypothetical protein
MLPLLLSIAVSTWWDFRNEEWDEKRRNSLNVPVFVVCYSRWCPHCSGLPEGTREYSDGEGNRSDVYVTMIDCHDHFDECSHFHIRGTPHLVLVIGPKRKYWPRVYSKSGKDWNVFIDKYVKPSLREITTDAELLEAKREPNGGGTTFHLETPTSDTPLILQLANLSKEFRIYNDTFTFRVNPNITSPVLTAHVSPYCTARWTSGTLRQFLERYRFGSRHEYDQDEFRLYSRRSKMALLVVDDGLITGQNFALEALPKNFCEDITFGWLPVKDTKHLLKEFRQNVSDLPFMLYTDPDSKCRAFNRGRASEAEKSGFLRKAIGGELCDKTFLDGLIRAEDGTFQSPHHVITAAEAGIRGIVFWVGYLALGLMAILAVRLKSSGEEGKQE